MLTDLTTGACQTIFIDVENPEASMPVTADRAKRGANVALIQVKRVYPTSVNLRLRFQEGKNTHRSTMSMAQAPANVPCTFSISR